MSNLKLVKTEAPSSPARQALKERLVEIETLNAQIATVDHGIAKLNGEQRALDNLNARERETHKPVPYEERRLIELKAADAATKVAQQREVSNVLIRQRNEKLASLPGLHARVQIEDAERVAEDLAACVARARSMSAWIRATRLHLYDLADKKLISPSLPAMVPDDLARALEPSPAKVTEFKARLAMPPDAEQSAISILESLINT